ncbi:hypothetical protein V7S43_019076 [Phytophthora oleae]|uniref:Uncharacterized protein n=1 Tax=Phytophthora oleae TaxID=2107226 RepID=A0ABD3G474_9STRA
MYYNALVLALHTRTAGHKQVVARRQPTREGSCLTSQGHQQQQLNPTGTSLLRVYTSITCISLSFVDNSGMRSFFVFLYLWQYQR